VKKNITINNRTYNFPIKPVVVVCIDGNAPEYFESAIDKGLMPFVKKQKELGNYYSTKCHVPTITNPNNISIVTGTAPYYHGICGNFYYDKKADKDIMMTDPSLIKVPTIFEEFQKEGAKIVAITAKDKLRKMLAKGLSFSEGKAICFSSEKSSSTTMAEHGIDNVANYMNKEEPDVYSADLSTFVFEAGIKLLQEYKPDLMYLTTTDYIQHTYSEEEETALEFYNSIDSYLAKLDQLGATIVVTADHGMNYKVDRNNEPSILYLNSVIKENFPDFEFRTILPITDPYVAHHGALGSFAGIYIENKEQKKELIKFLESKDEILEVLTKKQAVEIFNLDKDRIADIIVVSKQAYVLGKTAQDHDLSQLHSKLRSHGGVTEQKIPLVSNFKIDSNKIDDLLKVSSSIYNRDAFWLALNND